MASLPAAFVAEVFARALPFPSSPDEDLKLLAITRRHKSFIDFTCTTMSLYELYYLLYIVANGLIWLFITAWFGPAVYATLRGPRTPPSPVLLPPRQRSPPRWQVPPPPQTPPSSEVDVDVNSDAGSPMSICPGEDIVRRQPLVPVSFTSSPPSEVAIGGQFD